ncbi:hypothetical protein PIB30_081120 [Stylosanthes scabra]|uniref:Uncharacterized protein n=1 Tax=Stylosanthes scabra TaxID=79078 RepID=A0ABU6WSF8_9FABA|nr:hypothetical protein [Stylosanthes scabra]
MEELLLLPGSLRCNGANGLGAYGVRVMADLVNKCCDGNVSEIERMKVSVGYGFLEFGCLKEIGRKFWASELFENGSFSKGIDSSLWRIDSYDSGLKENVILVLQSRFSHCPNRFRFPQRARVLVLTPYESVLALLESIPPC